MGGGEKRKKGEKDTIRNNLCPQLGKGRTRVIAPVYEQKETSKRSIYGLHVKNQLGKEKNPCGGGEAEERLSQKNLIGVIFQKAAFTIEPEA